MIGFLVADLGGFARVLARRGLAFYTLLVAYDISRLCRRGERQRPRVPISSTPKNTGRRLTEMWPADGLMASADSVRSND